MSGVSNSSGHLEITSRPCSCDAVATALRKLVLKYDTACILSHGESHTNQAAHIINAQGHPDKAAAVGRLICKLGVVPDANGNAVTVFKLDSLPNAILLYQPLHWSMDHLNGWVLVPSLQTLDRLIAELKRANRAWEQAFQVDLQAVRKLVARLTPSRDYLPLHVDSSDLDEPLTPPLMLETSAEAQGLDSAALDEQWSLEEQERKAEFEAAAAAALGKAPRTTEGTEGVEGGC